MIAHLTIRGLGPHADTALDFDPDGLTVLSGPSEAGKSTALDATCYALWGCGQDGRPLPAELVREGEKRAEVAVRLKTGATILRSRTAGGQQRRTVRSRDGRGEQTFTREEEFRAAIGKLGAYAESSRLVMVPFAWVALAGEPGGGRRLRDVLARIMPEQNVGAIVARLMGEAGQPFRDNDPLAEDRAVELRRQTNERRAQCAGRKAGLDELAARLEAEPVAVPDEQAIARARKTVDASAAWGRHDLAAESHGARVTTWERATASRKAWLARKAELGEPPAGNPAALKAAQEREVAALNAHYESKGNVIAIRGQLGAAETNRDLVAQRVATGQPEVKSAADKLRVAVGLVATAQRKLDQLAAAGTRCPTCDRDGWTDAAAELDRARNALAGYEAEQRDQDAAYVATLEATTGRLAEELATAEESIAGCRLRLAEAEEAEGVAWKAHDDAKNALMAERAAQAGPEAWGRNLRSLGPEPTVEGTPAVPPVPPSVPRPSAEDVAEARDLLDRATRATGAAAQRERDQRETTSALATASEALDELTAECTRLDALVDAVRHAPSIAAREQLAVFGDLGPVTITFPSDGAAIEIAFDGRPWTLASTGRQIVCDASFRAGLRCALGMPYLPIWIDRVQDVGGQELPALDGPVVLLRTTDEGPLRTRTARTEAHVDLETGASP